MREVSQVDFSTSKHIFRGVGCMFFLAQVDDRTVRCYVRHDAMAGADEDDDGRALCRLLRVYDENAIKINDIARRLLGLELRASRASLVVTTDLRARFLTISRATDDSRGGLHRSRRAADR